MKKILFAIESRLTGVLVGGALLFAASNAVSQSTLADLSVPGATITVGDLVFYDFSNISQVGGLSVPLSSIYVVPTTDDEGNIGIQFQSAFWSLGGALQSYDLGIDFMVRTVDGTPLIEDDDLAVTGGILYDGATHVAETVLDTNDNSLSTLEVYINSTGQHTEDDSLFGSVYDTIEVTKDFSMTTGVDPLSQVFVSHFDQTFSEVPEPSSALFLGLGGLVLACYRRFTR
jgi:hypothetical protein